MLRLYYKFNVHFTVIKIRSWALCVSWVMREEMEEEEEEEQEED
jgi:hypothetical protein